MIRLAIRDDDMNFFTKVEDIQYVYHEIPDFPVSFAVVPRVTDLSTVGACPDTKGNATPQPIGNNRELLNYMRKRLTDGTADILLHGQSHRYVFKDCVRIPEMRQDKPLIGEDWLSTIAVEKEYLESLFGYKISVFVAPSNVISKSNLRSVVSNKLNFSGIVPIKFEREVTIKNLLNYMKRWMIRAVNRLPYPGVMTYSDHKEINACVVQGYDYLMTMFDYCCKKKLPMVINTHYWHLRDNPDEREMVIRFIKDAISKGAKPTKLSDILE